MITLTSFVAGSVVGAWHWGFWTSDAVPATAPVVLGESRLGVGGAMAISLLALAAIVLLTRAVAARLTPPPVDSVPGAPGCNIGAYFSGIASGSLHGWAWGGLALIGTFLGLRLRPLFGLANPKPTDSVC